MFIVVWTETHKSYLCRWNWGSLTDCELTTVDCVKLQWKHSICEWLWILRLENHCHVMLTRKNWLHIVSSPTQFTSKSLIPSTITIINLDTTRRCSLNFLGSTTNYLNLVIQWKGNAFFRFSIVSIYWYWVFFGDFLFSGSSLWFDSRWNFVLEEMRQLATLQSAPQRTLFTCTSYLSFVPTKMQSMRC